MAGILHVCTANLIRSPVAEVLTRTRLHGYPVGSAGLRAFDGGTIWPAAAVELVRRGVPEWLLGPFRSRAFTPALGTRADIVLTATRRQRDAIMSDTPFLLGKVFTWRELAWLSTGLVPDDVPGTSVPERLCGLLTVVGTRRGYLIAPAGESLDVVDPVDGPLAALLDAVDQIDDALAVVTRLVTVPEGARSGYPGRPALGTASVGRAAPEAG